MGQGQPKQLLWYWQVGSVSQCQVLFCQRILDWQKCWQIKKNWRTKMKKKCPATLQNMHQTKNVSLEVKKNTDDQIKFCRPNGLWRPYMSSSSPTDKWSPVWHIHTSHVTQEIISVSKWGWTHVGPPQAYKSWQLKKCILTGQFIRNWFCRPNSLQILAGKNFACHLAYKSIFWKIYPS